jgi:glycosyltransferase involved in cell wall biosynthesis
MPKVSVLMPAYNSEKYISKAIESILNQTFSDFEFIIIDDCSTDNTWQIIEKYAKLDKRIKAYKNKKNLKIVKTRNKGFKLMNKNSKFIAIFDSDDISLPNRLEIQLNFLEKNKEYGIVGSFIKIINENNKISGKRKYPITHEEIIKKIILYSPFAQPSVMIRKSAIDYVGQYDKKFTGIPCEDYDLWFRILIHYKGYNINKYLIKYRISTTQSKTTHLKPVLKNTIKLQLKWLFNKNYFTFYAIPNIFLELLLLLLPSKLILWLFKKIKYK